MGPFRALGLAPGKGRAGAGGDVGKTNADCAWFSTRGKDHNKGPAKRVISLVIRFLTDFGNRGGPHGLTLGERMIRPLRGIRQSPPFDREDGP